MKPLFFLKLGGSLITDKSKPFTAKPDIIARLSKEIAEARNEQEFNLIIGHGGGSFPHVSATKYQTQKGIVSEDSYRGISEVQNDASKLNRIVVEELIKKGENAVSIEPFSSCVAENKRIVEFYLEPIKKLLEYNMIPVPYGDVAIDLKHGCCIISTEEILNFLAKKIKPDKIIVAGKVDGVFTADPNINKNAKFIPEISKNNFEEIKKYLSVSDGYDVTGGMLHKVEEMMELAELGFKSQIINATKEGNLKNALLGESVGTIIR